MTDEETNAEDTSVAFEDMDLVKKARKKPSVVLPAEYELQQFQASQRAQRMNLDAERQEQLADKIRRMDAEQMEQLKGYTKPLQKEGAVYKAAETIGSPARKIAGTVVGKGVQGYMGKIGTKIKERIPLTTEREEYLEKYANKLQREREQRRLDAQTGLTFMNENVKASQFMSNVARAKQSDLITAQKETQQMQAEIDRIRASQSPMPQQSLPQTSSSYWTEMMGGMGGGATQSSSAYGMPSRPYQPTQQAPAQNVNFAALLGLGGMGGMGGAASNQNALYSMLGLPSAPVARPARFVRTIRPSTRRFKRPPLATAWKKKQWKKFTPAKQWKKKQWTAPAKPWKKKSWKKPWAKPTWKKPTKSKFSNSNFWKHKKFNKLKRWARR